MMWVEYQDGSVQTTFGYTRVTLWRSDVGKAWTLTTYNDTDSSLSMDKKLHARDLGKAKKRALKFLIALLTDRRDTINAWLKQMKKS